MATLAERVVDSLRASGPLDDDILAARQHVARQQINQVCRRLTSQGVIRRHTGPSGKIVNALNEAAEMPVVEPVQRPTEPK